MLNLKKGAQVKIISGKDKGKTGEILEINKLPSKIRSLPIFINDSIIYLNNKNRLIVLD